MTWWPPTTKGWKAIGVCAVLGAIILAVMFFSDQCGDWSFRRGVSKDKQKIGNTVNAIANVQNEIANLEQKKAELQGELNRDQEALANNVTGLDEAKKETNQAIENFQKAVNANTNVNATAKDIEDALRKLEGQ